MLLQDIRHSLRLLGRSPGFTVVAVFVLALGIGANAAVFSVVDALILHARPGRIDRLVQIFSRNRVKPDEYSDFSYGQYVDLRDRSGVFDALAALTFTTVGVRDGDLTHQSFASVVSANYFDTMGVRLAAGRAFTIEEERPGANVSVVIASYGAWRKTGFDPGFIGRTVRVNAADFTVVGVAPRGFAGTMSLVSPEWWFPLGAYDLAVNEMFRVRASGLGDRGNMAINVAGAVKAGIDTAAAERALALLAQGLEREYPDTDRDRVYILGGLPRTSFSSSPQTDSTSRTFSLLLAAMAVMILVVACLNLANLLLARGVVRRREMAIRQALGSGRGRIVRQLLVEGFVLSALGATAGLVVGAWTTRLLVASLGSAIPLGIEVIVEPSLRTPLAAVAFAVFSTLCFALGPALALSRPVLQHDLKGELPRIAGRVGVGPVLIAVQLMVSLALVAVGGLFVRASGKAAGADAGFSFDRQLIVTLDPSLAGYSEARTRALYARVLERVRSLPGVDRAALASTVPFGELSEGRQVNRPGQPVKRNPQFDIVTADYFATLGLPIVRGRAFSSADDLAGLAVRQVIIDVRLSRQLFGNDDPLGQSLQMPLREGDKDPGTFTIVGIVPTVRHDLFASETDPRPHVYVPYGSIYRGRMTLHVRSSASASESAVLGAVQAELRRLDTSLPILAAKTMNAHRNASLSEWGVRTAATLFSTFGALALLLATIGVYGLKAYDVSRRRREIGIRMALGATVSSVQWLVIGEGLRTTLIGLCAGVLLALGLGKLVSGLLYRVSPFDPVVMISAAVVLSTSAILACYFPARRATRVVPLEALRTE